MGTQIEMGKQWSVKGSEEPVSSLSLEKGNHAKIVTEGEEIVVFSSDGTQIQPGGLHTFREVKGKVVDHTEVAILYGKDSYVQRGQVGQPNFLKITHVIEPKPEPKP